MNAEQFNFAVYSLMEQSPTIFAETKLGILQGWCDVLRENIKTNYQQMEKDFEEKAKQAKVKMAEEIISNANKPKVVEEGAGTSQTSNTTDKSAQGNGNGAAANESGTGQADVDGVGDGPIGKVDNVRPISKSRSVRRHGSPKRRS